MDDSEKLAEIEQRISESIRLSLTASKDELFAIMQQSSEEFLLAALRNPELDEKHLQVLLKRRGLPEKIFGAIYASKRLIDSYAVKYSLVCHPETPAHISLTLLPHLYLFDILKICFLPGSTQDQRLAAERTIVQRIPTQPLGNKLTLARRGTSLIAEAILRLGDPQTLAVCLDNPRLKEGSVYQFLTSSASNAETISIVARNCRWKSRPNIILAILKNPRTPAIWFNLFLSGLSNKLLRDLQATPRLSTTQKELIRQALLGRGK